MTEFQALERGNYSYAAPGAVAGANCLLQAARRLRRDLRRDPSLEAWADHGRDLIAKVDENTALYADRFDPGADVEFTLVDLETGSTDFEMPSHIDGQVVCRATGREMGTLRAIQNLAGWVREEMSRTQAKGNRRERRSKRRG